MQKEKNKDKSDYYSKVALAQIILCIMMLLSVFLLKSNELAEDYRRIMSYSIAKDDFTSIASAVRDYLLNESALKEVFGDRVNFTMEGTEPASETEEAALNEGYGGADLNQAEVPSYCSFAPLKLTAPILSPIEKGRYTSYFGFRTNPITKEYGFHTGLDIAAPEGTRIRAALNGTVDKTGEDSRAGKYIYLTHENGLRTFYCHCSEILAEEGAVIRQGETIALVGSTGMSTGPHVHFEVRKNNIRFDPYPLLENEA